MNVLMISNSDLEGGAARATYRLHQGLQKTISSTLLVQTKHSRDCTVHGKSNFSGIAQAIQGLRLTLENVPSKLYRNREKAIFSSQWLPDQVAVQANLLHPDIINLHWINNGYIQIESIAKFAKPVVWTLHDMWAFTGGCHYDQNCSRYVEACGSCPQLGSTQNQDLSRWIWQRKAKAWKNLDLTIVTPSNWLAECARKSSLLGNQSIHCIPNGIDADIYRPIGRSAARDILQLPQDKFLIMTGSLGVTSDKRKGIHLLKPALQELSQNTDFSNQIEIVVLGESKTANLPELSLKTHFLGMLHDDPSLALAYSAADIFIAPSVQDNLPNTIMEALACGTPCIGFDIGGLPDMIEHQKNGFLADPYEVSSLVHGIVWLLEDRERYLKLVDRARRKVEQEFTLEVQAKQYLSLFSQVLETQSSLAYSK
jgi:glycosyltransferase involved in cell wall biosynthesis